LQEKKPFLIKHMVKVIIFSAAAVLLGILLYKNIAPFGAVVTYKVDLKQNPEYFTVPAPLTPSAALGKGKNGAYYQIPQQKMITDQVTFDLKVTYEKFATAEVKVKYQGDPEEFLVGVQSFSSEQLITMPLYNKSLNELSWDKVEGGRLTFFQRTKKFNTVAGFIATPRAFPRSKETNEKTARITTYYCDFAQQYDIDMDTINDGTVVEASLRGPHSFYTYVKDESLKLILTKQDINWYEGPDPLDINIYSGDRLIYSQSIPDDGDVSKNGKPLEPQRVEVNVPNLKEGVYKIVLDCGCDVIIKNIASRQKYLCFERKLFLANHKMYKMGPTKSNIVYTNGKELTAETCHFMALQVLQVNDNQEMVVSEMHEEFSMNLSKDINKIKSEKSDVILNVEDGYFAFSKDSLFDPFPIKVVPYSKDLVLTNIDYILTDYTIPQKEKGWLVNTAVIDLSHMKAKDNKLNFVLYAPGLVKRGEEIVLGSIEITLKKSGLIGKRIVE